MIQVDSHGYLLLIAGLQLVFFAGVFIGRKT